MKRLVVCQNKEAADLQLDGLDIGELSDEEADVLCIRLLRGLRRSWTDPTKAWLLSVRSRNVLQKAQVTSVYRLEQLISEEIVRMPGLGSMVAGEVLEEATSRGVDLPHWRTASDLLRNQRYVGKRVLRTTARSPE